MTQQGQRVRFGPDRVFAYTKEFDCADNGWNLAVEPEAPNDSNCKLQEVRDIMITENRMEHMEKIDHMRALLHALKQMFTAPQKTHPFLGVAGHRPVRLCEPWNL